MSEFLYGHDLDPKPEPDWRWQNATYESEEDRLAREIRDIENYLEFLKEKQRQKQLQQNGEDLMEEGVFV